MYGDQMDVDEGVTITDDYQRVNGTVIHHIGATQSLQQHPVLMGEGLGREDNTEDPPIAPIVEVTSLDNKEGLAKQLRKHPPGTRPGTCSPKHLKEDRRQE